MKEVIKKCEEKMTKTCENLDGEFSNIRAGRANPNLLNRIMVEYYGTPTPMQQVGNISVPEPRIIQINPWEKSLLKAIEKAILASDLGSHQQMMVQGFALYSQSLQRKDVRN